MPVTIHRPPVEGKDFSADAWGRTDQSTSDASLLQGSCKKESAKAKRVIQSSFSNLSHERVFSSPNGFVRAVWSAYSNHHHLSLRPEDIWFSILSQLSFYINKNSEELRSLFVAHEGKKDIVVKTYGSTETVDFGKLAVTMTQMMRESVVDPELVGWIMPDFTTTETADTVTAAVLMMGTMQNYFSYGVDIGCGIPSVTLLGAKDDWTKIRNRVEKIPQFGKEAEQFAKLLRPVLDHFLLSFDDPTDTKVVDFWANICDERPYGSGSDYLTGWITAFCFWTNQGYCLFYSEQLARWMPKTITVDGVKFHPVSTEKIPGGFTSVPVKVNDHGLEFTTRMVAGSVGIRVSSSPPESSLDEGPSIESQALESREKLDSIQPVSGWWIYELKEGEE
ncbi:hypothetical protein ACJ41O_003920 [Fusarium nematophilum]